MKQSQSRKEVDWIGPGAMPTADEGNGNLFDRRLIMVAGKGGVGKTTLSAALGMAAAKLRKNVLLVEVGDADTIGPLFLGHTLPEKPAAIHPNIWGVRINAKAVLEDYIYVHIGSQFIANRITRSKLFDHLAEAAPGLREVMTLGQLWRWERGVRTGDHPEFDFIIVDAPATGHGLSLLRVPQTLIDMMRVGPIVEETRVVLKLFQNPGKTWIVSVTLPEELPVNECLHFEQAARDDLGMPVQVTFVNGVYPKTFSDKEVKSIKSLWERQETGQDRLAVRSYLEAAFRKIIRQELQKTYIDEVKTHTSSRVIEIPFYFTNELTLNEMEAISLLLLNQFQMEKKVKHAGNDR